jgi:hypothetical protein
LAAFFVFKIATTRLVSGVRLQQSAAYVLAGVFALLYPQQTLIANLYFCPMSLKDINVLK